MSLLLGNEVVVNNVVCQTINGTPASSFVALASPSLVISSVSTTGNQMTVIGTASNIPNGTLINIYVNTSDSFTSITSHGTFDVAQMNTGVPVTLTGITLSASTTYYVFIYASLSGTSTSISKSFSIATPSATHTLTLTNITGYINDTKILVTGTCANVTTNITLAYSTGTNSVGVGSRTALTPVIPVSQQPQFTNGGLVIDLSPTILQLVSGTTYWIYLTETSGSATAQLQCIPISSTTVAVTNFSPYAITLDTAMYVIASTQNIPDNVALLISYNTTGVSTSRTAIANVLDGDLNMGTTINTPFSFANNTTYYFYVSDLITNVIYTSNTIVIPPAPVATVTITDLQTYVGASTILVTPTFTAISVGALFSLYVNTTNSNSGGTKIADVTGRKKTGIQQTITNTYTFTPGTTYYFYVVMGSTTSSVYAYTPIFVSLSTPSIIYGQSLVLPIATNATPSSLRISTNTLLYVYVSTTSTSLGSWYGGDKLLNLINNFVQRVPNATTFNGLTTYYISLVYNPTGAMTAAGIPTGAYSVLSKVSVTADVVPDSYPPVGIAAYPSNNVNTTTSPTNRYGYGQYIASSSVSTSDPYIPFYGTFYGTQQVGLADAWTTGNKYNNNGGYMGSATTAAGTNTYSGEWIQLALPSLVYLTGMSIKWTTPSPFALLTSQDGSSWNANTNLLSVVGTNNTIKYFITTKGGVYTKFIRIVFLTVGTYIGVASLYSIQFYATGSSGLTNDSNVSSSQLVQPGSTTPVLSPVVRLLSVAPTPKSLTVTISNITNLSAILTGTNISANYGSTDAIGIYNNPYDPLNAATNLVGTPTVAQLRAGWFNNQLTAATTYNFVVVAPTGYSFVGTVASFTTRNTPFTLTVSNISVPTAKVTATSVDSPLLSNDIVQFTDSTYTLVAFSCTVLQLQNGFVLTGLLSGRFYNYYIAVYQGGSSIATYYTTCPQIAT